MRNLACSGAKALAVTDNLNFGNPNKPEAYYMLRECVKGLADACAFFDVPVVGGNVSLYNEHGEGAIDPTPVVSMVGLIDRQELVTRSQVKKEGLELFLLGGGLVSWEQAISFRPSTVKKRVQSLQLISKVKRNYRISYFRD